MTGWVEFHCKEPENAEILFQYGEILQKGKFYNENLRTAKAEYRYIANGKHGWVHPHFTFYGFRYVKIQGIQEINPEDFVGCVLHSRMEQTGTLVTSNGKVNQLIHNALWGQKGNFLDTPTDCPQRDERMGWTGDAEDAAFYGELAAHIKEALMDEYYSRTGRLAQETQTALAIVLWLDLIPKGARQRQVDTLMAKRKKICT